MGDSTGRKQRHRIEYLEALALKQAALLRTIRAACTLPEAAARKVKEVLDETARIHQAQAARKQPQGEPKP